MADNKSISVINLGSQRVSGAVFGRTPGGDLVLKRFDAVELDGGRRAGLDFIASPAGVILAGQVLGPQRGVGVFGLEREGELAAAAFGGVALFGGGYATGRELAEFFLPSGPLGGVTPKPTCSR